MDTQPLTFTPDELVALTGCRHPAPQVAAIGRPQALSSLARLLLRLHTTPPVAPVRPPAVDHEQPRRPVLAIEQGPQ